MIEKEGRETTGPLNNYWAQHALFLALIYYGTIEDLLTWLKGGYYVGWL